MSCNQASETRLCYLFMRSLHRGVKTQRRIYAQSTKCTRQAVLYGTGANALQSVVPETRSQNYLLDSQRRSIRPDDLGSLFRSERIIR